MRRLTLALVPARAGSKRLPGKNRKRLAGSSLVEIAIRQGIASGVCDVLVVSTDDQVIAQQARRMGVHVVDRPGRLARDSTTTIDVARHALRLVERDLGKVFSTIVILQPTSPLRSVSDIRGALALCVRARGRSVMTVSESRHWTHGMRLDQAGRLTRAVRPGRRGGHARTVYVPNGAVYVISRSRLNDQWSARVSGYVMPPQRSIDIDDAFDLAVARSLLRDD